MLGASQYDPKVLTLSRAPTQGSGHSFLQGVSPPFVISVFQTHYNSKTSDTWYNHTGRLLGLVFLLDLDVALVCQFLLMAASSYRYVPSNLD